MSSIHILDAKQNQNDLFNNLIKANIQVGMTEFNSRPEIEGLPNGFQKVGNFELDVLAIELKTNQIVMLDYDNLSFIMGIAAISLNNFVKALSLIENYIEQTIQNEDLIKDVIYVNDVLERVAEIAGHKNFKWYYQMSLGI